MISRHAIRPSPRRRLPCVRPLALIALLLAAGAVDAKRIYSYQDDRGVMHFSDRPPSDPAADVSERLVDVDPKRLVYLREDGPDSYKRYSMWNGYGGPIEVLMDIENAVNVVSEPGLPGARVIPPQQYSLVLQVQPIDDRLPWSYSLSYRTVPGDPAAVPDPSAVYRLPFDESEPRRVDQAFGGTQSHAEAHSLHAVDFAMDAGTPVRAARAGVVMAVESDFFRAGTDIAKFGDRANHIRIVHSDGTMAVYAHLELESVLVGIGNRVRAGEVIASSGNTGYSSGPHLHFVIQRNQGGTLVSVPFEFTIDGKRVTPQFGQMLGAE